MKNQLLMLSLCVLTFGGYAQKNDLTLKVGYGHLIRQDLNFSPMIHKKGSPLNFHGAYNHTGEKVNHALDVMFNIYNPSITEPFDYYKNTSDKTYTTTRHSFKQLEINYSFDVPVYKGDKFTLAVGGREHNRLFASEYYFAETSSFSYYFSFGVDARLRMNYLFNEKNELSATLHTPLASFNTRSPYLGIDSQYLEDNLEQKGFKAFLNYISHAKLQSWNVAQDLDLTLNYKRHLSEKFDLTGSYFFSANFNQSPTTFASIQNTFLIGAAYKF
ncbi:MAG: hypothetical protein H6582_12385 [Crocinitomicaceae bacterium]|nr:hypothetical protein [Crocinitomicaceae bacterium]